MKTDVTTPNSFGTCRALWLNIEKLPEFERHLNNVQGDHASCACLAQPVQRCWKSCADGSIGALHLGDHGTKEILPGICWLISLKVKECGR